MTSPSNDNEKSAKDASARAPSAGGPAARTAPCPVCAAPAIEAYAPFCSKRCADVDLHRWLSGGYAIPAAEDDSDGAAGEEWER